MFGNIVLSSSWLYGCRLPVRMAIVLWMPDMAAVVGHDACGWVGSSQEGSVHKQRERSGRCKKRPMGVMISGNARGLMVVEAMAMTRQEEWGG